MNIFLEETKKQIFWSCLTACVISSIISLIAGRYFYFKVEKIQAQDNKEIMGVVISYLTGITDDEYDEIAQELRHDLIYHVDTKQLIQHIPNTATDCPTCKSAYEYPVYFLANNTGELYHIDTKRQLTGEQFTLSAGYDEISQTRLSIIYDHSCIANIDQKHNVVSVNRMKTIFCDNCIDKIIAAIDGQYITTFVIFIPQAQEFYPINEDTEISLEGIAMEISFDKQNREMEIISSW